MDAEERLPVGAQIGDYTVTHFIGRGGMGVVYGAVHPVIGKRVAIKCLRTTVPQQSSNFERFVQEARAVNRIQHPGVVDIFAFGRLPDGRPYLVMDLIEGETVSARLKRAPPLTWDEALAVMVDVCSAVAAAHQAAVVHRDLKPENIMLATVDGRAVVKLLDFGVAKLIEAPSGTPSSTITSGLTVGTPSYMAPEQCRARPVDHRTDLYALGVILFRMFAGRLPFAGSSEYEILDGHVARPPPRPSSYVDLPPALEALILACLEKERTLRPEGALVVRERLDQIRGALTATEGARPLPPRVDRTLALVSHQTSLLGSRGHDPPVAPRPTRSRSRPALLLLVGAAVVLACGWAFLPWRSRDPAPIAVAPSPLPSPKPAPIEPPIAPPSPPPEASATLEVTVDARHPRWVIDGVPRSDRSQVLRAEALAPGSHRVRVDADGFEPIEEQIALAPGARVSLTWRLHASAHRSRDRRGANRASTPASRPAVDDVRDPFKTAHRP